MHLLLLIGLVVFSVLAVLIRDLLKSAISLAVASIFLAILFFRMSSPYVGVFELSVVAGLITVLFITAITMTRDRENDVPESKIALLVFPAFFLLLILIDFLVIRKLTGRIAVLAGSEEGNFGQILWNQRTFDLIGQIGVIFAGVFAVLALFRHRSKHE
jgi:NADH-quinone oxidoreductase subunit J